MEDHDGDQRIGKGKTEPERLPQRNVPAKEALEPKLGLARDWRSGGLQCTCSEPAVRTGFASLLYEVPALGAGAAPDLNATVGAGLGEG